MFSPFKDLLLRMAVIMGIGAAWPCDAVAQSWLLVYAGGPDHARYTAQRFTQLLYPEGRHRSKPLVGGIVCLETRGRSGHMFNKWGPNGPPPASDYFGYLDTLIGPSGALVAADSVVASHSGTLSVAIMLPYPLGTRIGRPVRDSRLTFVSSYFQYAESLFVSRRFRALRLWGFYWFPEAVTETDTAIVQYFTGLAHGNGLKAIWIPYLGSPLASRWKELGFDQAYLQPNYFVVASAPPTQVDSALADALAWGMGLEIEFDRRLLSDSHFRGRLGPYLDALETRRAKRLTGIAVYEGGGALWELSASQDAELRRLYRRLLTVVSRW